MCNKVFKLCWTLDQLVNPFLRLNYFPLKGEWILNNTENLLVGLPCSLADDPASDCCTPSGDG